MLQLLRHPHFWFVSPIMLAIGFVVSLGCQIKPVAAQSDNEPLSVVSLIEVEGTERIEPETVISYMLVKEGDAFNARIIDQSLKSLFNTGLFSDVTITRNGSELLVSVVENPIINRIVFEGNRRLDNEKLSEEIQLRPRVVFTRSKVRSDVQRMIELYRRSGRFAASIEPMVIQLPQNRVNLVYEITEGPKTKIRDITVLGNEVFSDKKLLGVVASKESKWYNLFGGNDTYDPDRLTFDRELLRQFFLRRGYADFRVVSAVAELTPDRKDFYIAFTIEEGNIYKFGKIDIDSQLADLKPEDLLGLLQTETGDIYNAEAIDKSIEALSEAAGQFGYAFANIRPRIRRNREEQIIDLTFRILEAPRVYVERIVINGNVRTLDKVIRREFRLVEGDAFNSERMRRSRLRIRGLGFFDEVEIEQLPGSAEDRTVLEVTVQERSTGELSIGAGFSSDENFIIDVGLRERNLLGRGQDLRLNFNSSSRSRNLDLGFTEPYFTGRDIAAGIDLFNRKFDFLDISGFQEDSIGFSLRTAFPLTEYLRLTARYTLRSDEVKIASGLTTSPIVQESIGNFTTSSVGYTLTYNQLNDPLDPTEGYIVQLTQDLAGLGGNVDFTRNRFLYSFYHSIAEGWIFNFIMEQGFILGLGQDVNLNNRFFLGGPKFRGFDTAGVGPRDLLTDDALGGNFFYLGSFNLALPLGPLEQFGIDATLFFDFGSLFKLDTAENFGDFAAFIRDTRSIRMTAGIGFDWQSPLGPFRVDLAKAIKKEEFDDVEFFQFNVGTRF